MIGYKGFDKNFCCRGYQYEVGKTYHHNGKLVICESGFHFCDTPLAVFEFYKPTESRFALVETSDNIVSNHNHKFCTDELKIIKELSLHDLIACAKNVTANTGYRSAATNTGDCSVATNTGVCSAATNTGYRSAATNTGHGSAATNTGDCSAATNTGDCSVATNTGNRSVATNTGDCSAATNTGDYSAATNTGDCSVATVAGKLSVAVALGQSSRAKGALGCWLVLSHIENGRRILKAVEVDGNTILPDTFYTLDDKGQVVRCVDD